MIIDLTVVFDFAHHIWDVFGVLLFGGIAIMTPCAVVIASIIKILEHKKSKLEQGVNK